METGLVTNRTSTPVLNGVYEYLLVAHPDAAVSQRLIAEKQHFSAQYQHPGAAKTKPHITVANFMAKEEMEETIIRWMHRIISSQKSFQVVLDKYNGFAEHTIYLRVQNHQPFQQLAKELKVVDQYVRSYGCPAMHLGKFPHLTIARQLPDTLYKQAIPYYEEQEFHASFDVKELILLRRGHQFDTCKQVNKFALLPQ